jgi:predicted dehydrogenase
MLRIGIIGCGKIADSHAEQIQRIRDCQIVGACDQEELMARQFQERFGAKHYFGDVGKFLDEGYDVVHITTPPQSHFELGKLCLESGCHVYIEKPFTVKSKEAEDLINLAIGKGLKITVGHDDQFTHAARRMRGLVRSGYLGGHPVHMESYYCYDLGDESYAKTLLGDKGHWVRTLPGKLLHNVISHGISKIVEFLLNDKPQVVAHGFTSRLLRGMAENEIIDELRVIINDDDRVTAYFTFSSQMRPGLHGLRIFGPRNGLVVDHDEQTVIKLRGSLYKSYLEKFVPQFVFAGQYVSNALINMKYFLKRDLHMKSGMKFLIESFYQSVREGREIPISYREILLTARIMEDIFQQIYGKRGVGQC